MRTCQTAGAQKASRSMGGSVGTHQVAKHHTDHCSTPFLNGGENKKKKSKSHGLK